MNDEVRLTSETKLRGYRKYLCMEENLVSPKKEIRKLYHYRIPRDLANAAMASVGVQVTGDGANESSVAGAASPGGSPQAPEVDR